MMVALMCGQFVTQPTFAKMMVGMGFMFVLCVVNNTTTLCGNGKENYGTKCVDQ